MKVVNIVEGCTVQELRNLFQANPDCAFVHFEHSSSLGNDENLITQSRKNKLSYDILIELVNSGFYLYMTKENKISSFVHHNTLPTLWKPLVEKNFKIDENKVVYSLHVPSDVKPRNLLVIFSSVNAPMYNSSLMRMFTQNFRSISDYISQDTAVLRIADLGGVVGSYYLNSNYLSNNEVNIQNLIFKIAASINVDKVSLFGVSKGASAAVFYGLKNNFHFLAVDPILSDHYYEVKENDLHFTKNTFPVSKQDKFENLLDKANFEPSVSRCIISSPNSQQFSYIYDILLNKYGKHFSFFLNNSSKIKSHPEVAPNSIHMITTIINCNLNNIKFENKVYPFI